MKVFHHNDCTYCEKPIEGELAPHVCGWCGRPQPLERKPGEIEDFFEVLGVSRRFNQNPAVLEKLFYKFSRALHPDRFSALSGNETGRTLVDSGDRMTLVNRAYTTLKDPEKRRRHLLALEGVEIDEANKGEVPGDLAEALFEAKDALLDDPIAGRKKIAEFEQALRQALENEDRKIETHELRYDESRDSEYLQAIGTGIRIRNYLKSMERDLEKVLCRL